LSLRRLAITRSIPIAREGELLVDELTDRLKEVRLSKLGKLSHQSDRKADAHFLAGSQLSAKVRRKADCR
jgi:hypothetical protein